MFRNHSSVKLFQTITRLNKKNHWIYTKHFALFSTELPSSNCGINAVNEWGDAIKYDSAGWPIMSNAEETSAKIFDNVAEVSAITDEIPEIAVEIPEIAVEVHEKLFFPFELFISMLDKAHSFTGLPWWATIVSVTLFMRACLLPMNIMARKNAINMQLAKPYTSVLNEKNKKLLRKRMKDRNNPVIAEEQAEIKRRMALALDKHGGKFWKSIVPIFAQAPLFISFFMSLRTLGSRYPEFSSEGVLWFNDLSVPDSTYALPLISAVTMYSVIHFGSETAGKDPTATKMKAVMKGVSFIVPFMTYHFPSGLFVYWITNNSFSLVQGQFFEIPVVKKILGIKDVDHEALEQIESEFRMKEKKKKS